ncbi:MAG: hypothetical protein ACR2PI_20690 [Hyphomicrobiaceae bacterium]
MISILRQQVCEIPAFLKVMTCDVKPSSFCTHRRGYCSGTAICFCARKGKALILALLISSSLTEAAHSQDGNSYKINDHIELKFSMYAELGLEYIASRGNEYSSKYQFSAYGEKRASLTFWKNWTLQSVVKAEEFDTRDDNDDEEGYGVAWDSLYLEYRNARFRAYAGKFQARFGLASDADLGKYGSDFNDYDIDEQVGFGGSVRFGGASYGQHIFSASVFTADTSVLSDSLFFSRGRLDRSGGGPGNTGDLSSFAIAVDGRQLPWFSPNFTYHVGYAHLAPGEGDQDGSDAFVLGARQTGIKVGSDVEVALIGEVAYVSNVEGDGDDITYYTLGAAANYGRYNFTLVYAPRRVEANDPQDDRTEQLFAASAGYYFTDNLGVNVSYCYREEEDETDNTVSVNVAVNY